MTTTFAPTGTHTRFQDREQVAYDRWMDALRTGADATELEAAYDLAVERTHHAELATRNW